MGPACRRWPDVTWDLCSKQTSARVHCEFKSFDKNIKPSLMVANDRNVFVSGNATHTGVTFQRSCLPGNIPTSTCRRKTSGLSAPMIRSDYTIQNTAKLNLSLLISDGVVFFHVNQHFYDSLNSALFFRRAQKRLPGCSHFPCRSGGG